MPRPILGTPVARDSALTVKPRVSREVTQLRGPQLAARLRQKRSARYVEWMKRLDATGHVHDRAAVERLLEEIGNEFPDLTIDLHPIGIVSRCYLGPPYEVHRCDTAGAILEHYETFRAMSPLYERARSLASHGAYAFVEIYYDCVRAIAADGSVSLIPDTEP